MSDESFDAAVTAYHAAIAAVGRGDNGPALALYSREGDVVLANPLGPPIVGWDAIAVESAKVAARFAASDGSTMIFEEIVRHVRGDIGYFIGIERASVRRADTGEMTQMALRVTTILRREADGWRVALRHADRVTTPQP